MPQYDLNVRDYLRILRKHRYYLVVPPLVLVALTYFLTPSPTVSYKASASIKISQSTTLAGLMLQVFTYSSGDNIATQTRVLTSLPLMAELAQYLGTIPKDLEFKEILNNREHVTQLSILQSKVLAEQFGNTNIVQITAEAASREEVISIANGLADVFAEWSLEEKNQQVIEAKNFISEQLAQAEVRLKDAEDGLQAFLEANIDHLSLSTNEMVRLQKEKADIQRLMTTLERQVEQLESRMKSGSGNIDWISSSELGDSNLERFNDELIQLQLQRERLLVYQTEASPEVEALEGKIQTLLNNLAREYRATLLDLETRASNLEDELALVPKNDAELSRLRRDRQVASDAYTLLKTKYEEAAIREAEKIREVSVVEYATNATAILQGGKFSKSLVGGIVGLVLGFVLALLIESMDTSIATIEEIESYLEVPVLGVIPHIDREAVLDVLEADNPNLSRETLTSYSGLVSQFVPKSPVAEAYRSLRTNLEFTKLARPGRTFLVTSSTLEEGKSTTVANLALALAQSGKRVLVIESDLRRPLIHTYFGLPREPGLTEVLLGTLDWRDAQRSLADVFLGKLDMSSLVRTPGLDNLSFITSGVLPANPAELLGAAPMRSLIREVTEEFDIILFDSPPVLPVTDAAVLASQVDGVVLVYQLGRAGRGLLRRAKSHLETVQADLRGVILNDIKAEVSEFSSAEYYYQYYSRYTEGENARPRNRLNQAVAGVRERLTGRPTSPSGRTAPGPSAPRTKGASEYEDVLGITGDRDRSSD
jgi:tyrosine-protein kinase Etk/Wzc